MASFIPQKLFSCSQIAVRTLIFAASFAGLVAIGACLAVAASRFRYPFELEWMEGSMVDHVARVVRGQPLYVAPTPEFVPATYPPLFYWVSAVVARLTGVGFLTTRFTAILSSLACLSLTCAIVRRETRSWRAAIVSTGLFAATYRASGAWFDIGRGDTLFLALALCAFYVLRFGTSCRSGAWAAALLVLASLTKQTAFAVAVPLAIAALVTGWRRGLIYSLLMLAGMTVSHGLMHFMSHGWYGYYVFELPRRFSVRILDSEVSAFWTRDLLRQFGIASVLGAVWLLRGMAARNRVVWLYIGATTGMVAGSWLPRMQYGGYDNVLMPTYVIVAILAGICLHEMMGGEGRFSRPLLSGVAALLVILQLGMLAYDPRDQIPTSRDRQEGEWLLSHLSAIPGEVLLPFHGYLPSLSGSPTAAHRMAVSDVLGCDPNGAGAGLRREYQQLIREKRFAAIVLDRDDWFFMDEVREHYPQRVPAFHDSTVFWPRTGWCVRPLWTYLPADQVSAGESP